MQLRPYQIDAVNRIRDAFRRRVRTVLFQLPTGGGKTVVFSYIARHAAAKGSRVCILMHRRELIKQTCDKLNHPHGVIAAGFTPARHELIQVASVQTLINRLDQYQFDMFIVDECHHSVATTYLRCINASPRACVLGVTATPVRQTGRGLGDLFDELIQGPSVTDLTDDGFLAPAAVYAPSVIDTSGVSVDRGDYVHGELALAADKPTITGDAVQHYRRLADRKPAIAFCVSVQHAEHVADAFRRAGYRSVRVDGGTPQQERDQAIEDLGRGRLDVLTSCELISEGVDVPVVECGIMLRPTKSLALAIQQMGRILRPAPGKQAAIILDHAGNCLKHGLPADDRKWSLQSGLVQKRREEEPACPVRQCPQCFCVHSPAPVCPQCGHEYPVQGREVEQIDGELQRVEELRARMKQRQQIGQARTRAELEAIARARGYRPGWVDHILRARAARGAVANG